jgi:predicted lipoprotein with Yx(FWY)xxD motif
MPRLFAIALTLMLAAGPAAAAPTQTAQGPSGAILTDMEGRTLYTFDNDAPGVSNCVDACVANWPILAAAEGDVAEGDYAIIDRADGTRQWTYKGRPLYTFVKDAAPGDVAGDGVNEVWHLARP